ncbi:uncharacterized protein LOC135099676 isoform X1 [Scylla paramamosain]|uniref:uncharacterized protein LOC135099676 isoform X1 n=1 Tax=Scylla paramamosain TaxID=85552 RepID=UPI0030832198
MPKTCMTMCCREESPKSDTTIDETPEDNLWLQLGFTVDSETGRRPTIGEPAHQDSRLPPPLAGRWEGAVWVNTTWAAVSLAQWSEGGCPINRYSVVYRQTSAVTWIVGEDRVSKRVEGGRPV